MDPAAPAATSPTTVTRRRPLLHSLLNLVPLVGGLGYLTLGQPHKALRAFVAASALVGLNVVAASMDNRPASMALGPALFILQGLTALDVWQLASSTTGFGRRETSVPVLQGLLGHRVG